MTMNPKIEITKPDPRNQNNLTMNIHVAGNRNDVLEMLTYGTRSIMEALDITFVEYLEALMEARETENIEKILIDTSVFSENFEMD